MIVIYNIIEEKDTTNGPILWSLKTKMDSDWLNQNMHVDHDATLEWSREPQEQSVCARTFVEASTMIHIIIKKLIDIRSNYDKNVYIYPIIIKVAEEVSYGPSKNKTPCTGIHNVNSQNLYEIIREVYQNTGYGDLTRHDYEHNVPKKIRKSKVDIFDFWCEKLGITYTTVMPFIDSDDDAKFIITIKYEDINKIVSYDFDKKSVLFSNSTPLFESEKE